MLLEELKVGLVGVCGREELLVGRRVEGGRLHICRAICQLDLIVTTCFDQTPKAL